MKCKKRFCIRLMELVRRRSKIIFTIFTFFLAIIVLTSAFGSSIYYGVPPSYASFAIVHFAGYLFFILMPVEALYAYYIAAGYSSLLIFLFAILTALFAQFIDYAIGYTLSQNILKKLIGDKKEKHTNDLVKRYGNGTILFFNLFPLSSPIIILAAGMLKHNIKDTFTYSLLGLTIKYFIIFLIFM